MSKMRVKVNFDGVVDAIKPVEYVDASGRDAVAWRLILKLGEYDVAELRCTEDVAGLVKKRKSYTFGATVDPEPIKNENQVNPLRIDAVIEEHGYVFDDIDDDEYIKAREAYLAEKIAHLTPAEDKPVTGRKNVEK